jgi:DNA-binding transcriptional LysR family regulator
MHKTTLEQWSLLERVVEAGSFAKAAEETHRSQSSVSYNLSLLQERLGVALLVPEGRRAVLTPAGELLLNQVKPLLKAFSYVETRAATLRNGMRTRLDLVVDSIFPRRRLFAILRQFQQQYPQTQVRLTEVLENTRADAINDEADVMVLTRRQDITGLGEWLMNIDFVAVAHSQHPSFTSTRRLMMRCCARGRSSRLRTASPPRALPASRGPSPPSMPPLRPSSLRSATAGCQRNASRPSWIRAY